MQTISASRFSQKIKKYLHFAEVGLWFPEMPQSST